ncbi:MAG: hypothetical protein AAFR93_13370 [Pseudomonadota bacterium]
MVRLARGHAWPLRLCVGAVTAYGFVWLSPQIYYAYYRAIIPDLPAQWVIFPPPGLGEIWRLATFTDATSLSAHGRGLLIWAMCACALLARQKN